MTKFPGILIFLIFLAFFQFSGCTTPAPPQNTPAQSTTPETGAPQAEDEIKPPENPEIDLELIKPNENGRIMVVMFHNFVESFTPTKYDDGKYTTTFGEFEKLLPMLYEKGYRLISMQDYLNNNIDVPAGCIPMIFTFDDGSAGQFNLVLENGSLMVNKKSAVGMLEEFNKIHPDFGLKGTFYVNLGNSTFKGEGRLQERLQYLIGKGFEIGNHTYTHINMSEVKSADQIQKEIGQNQQKMYELVPNYKMASLALPFGEAPKALREYVAKGSYEDTDYENLAILEVGWDPALSPVSKLFDPLSIHRVRSPGIKPVDADLAWWLHSLSRETQYVSDGNPDTVTIPKEKEENINKERLNGRELILY